MADREKEFLQAGGSDQDIEPHQLLEPHNDIVRAADAFMGAATPDVLLDVSSLPKRFFFPVIKRLLQNEQVHNLVITYAIPHSYPSEALALNHNDWAQLPLFAGDYSPTPATALVVGVGFEALGLPEQVEHGSGLPVKLLLPFPAPPLSFQRSWELIRKLQAHREREDIRVYRVDAKSVSDTFDQLVTLTNGGKDLVELAPFGPKPMSVAMCLFALMSGAPVFYTQPTAYHPDYSIGVAEVGGQPEVYGYCVRIGRRNLYQLP